MPDGFTRKNQIWYIFSVKLEEPFLVTHSNFFFLILILQKKRLSLITTTGTIDIDNNGPLSGGSFHNNQNQRFSPQNSFSGPQSLPEQCPSTPTSTTDSRPHTPGSNPGSLKSKNTLLERCETPTATTTTNDDKSVKV